MGMTEVEIQRILRAFPSRHLKKTEEDAADIKQPAKLPKLPQALRFPQHGAPSGKNRIHFASG